MPDWSTIPTPGPGKWQCFHCAPHRAGYLMSTHGRPRITFKEDGHKVQHNEQWQTNTTISIPLNYHHTGLLRIPHFWTRFPKLGITDIWGWIILCCACPLQTVLCITDYLAASGPPHIRSQQHPLGPSCGNQTGVLTLPNAPPPLTPAENHGSPEKLC